MPKQSVMFDMLPEHVRLFKELSFQSMADLGWDTSGQLSIYPGVDPKRPFGNSGMVQQAAEILGFTEPGKTLDFRTRQKTLAILAGVPVALETAMDRQTFQPGEYKISRYGAWFSYKGAMMAVFWLRAIEKCFDIKDGNGDDMSDRAYDFVRAQQRHRNPYWVLADLENWAGPDSPDPYGPAAKLLEIFRDTAVRDYRELHPRSCLNDASLLNRLKSRGDPENTLWPFWSDKNC